MWSLHRRSVLRTMAGVGVAAIAGCNGGDGQSDGGGGDGGSDDGSDGEDEGTEEQTPGPDVEPAFETKLSAPNPERGDQFGRDVAFEGDTAVVAAVADEPQGEQSGAAYAFRHAGNEWSTEGTLIPEDGDEDDRFGSAVAVSGDTAIVGAEADDDPVGPRGGSAYVFRRGDGGWSQEAKLTPAEPERFALFGEAVAIDGDTAIVGAGGHSGNNGNESGAAYIFERSSGEWSQVRKLAPVPLDRADAFGRAVALHGDAALIGVPKNEDPNGSQAGSAYVYRRQGGSWEREARFAPEDGQERARFGHAVDLSGDVAVLGAPRFRIEDPEDSDDVLRVGAAYVFERTGEGWTERAELLAPDAGERIEHTESANEDQESDFEDDGIDRFGHAVGVQDGVVVVGSPTDDVLNDPDAGTLRVVQPVEGEWTEQAAIAARHGDAFEEFGTAIGFDAGRILVGAPLESLAYAPNSGAAHVYRL